MNTKDHVNNVFSSFLLYEHRLDVDLSRLKYATSIVHIHSSIPSTTSLILTTGHSTIRYHISTLKQRSCSTGRKPPISFLSFHLHLVVFSGSQDLLLRNVTHQVDDIAQMFAGDKKRKPHILREKSRLTTNK
jgi:hypothetical protein